MFVCVFRYRSARQFGADGSDCCAATRTRLVLTISAGHCRTTSVPGAWRLAQDSARVAVKIDALICRAERDRVADLHIVAEQSEFYRGPARGVHHAVIRSDDPRPTQDRRANGDTKDRNIKNTGNFRASLFRRSLRNRTYCSDSVPYRCQYSRSARHRCCCQRFRHPAP